MVAITRLLLYHQTTTLLLANQLAAIEYWERFGPKPWLSGALKKNSMVQWRDQVASSAPRRRQSCAWIHAGAVIPAQLNTDNDPLEKRSHRGWSWSTVATLSLIHLPATWPHVHHRLSHPGFRGPKPGREHNHQVCWDQVSHIWWIMAQDRMSHIYYIIGVLYKINK
jgi:hypothetical protein